MKNFMRCHLSDDELMSAVTYDYIHTHDKFYIKNEMGEFNQKEKLKIIFLVLKIEIQEGFVLKGQV
jgi:hypothetical protein